MERYVGGERPIRLIKAVCWDGVTCVGDGRGDGFKKKEMLYILPIAIGVCEVQ